MAAVTLSGYSSPPSTPTTPQHPPESSRGSGKHEEINRIVQDLNQKRDLGLAPRPPYWSPVNPNKNDTSEAVRCYNYIKAAYWASSKPSDPKLLQGSIVLFEDHAVKQPDRLKRLKHLTSLLSKRLPTPSKRPHYNGGSFEKTPVSSFSKKMQKAGIEVNSERPLSLHSSLVPRGRTADGIRSKHKPAMSASKRDSELRRGKRPSESKEEDEQSPKFARTTTGRHSHSLDLPAPSINRMEQAYLGNQLRTGASSKQIVVSTIPSANTTFTSANTSFTSVANGLDTANTSFMTELIVPELLSPPKIPFNSSNGYS